MAKFVSVAAPIFNSAASRGSIEAPQIVLRETRDTLESLAGYGYNLILLSEGVEALGMPIDSAESIDQPGAFLSLYLEQAQKLDCVIAGSIKLKENGRTYNSIIFTGPGRKIYGAYHKNFLTTGELESGLLPGKNAVVVDTPA